MGIVSVIRTETSLHEPTYFFICNLIINGIFGSFVFYPKLMIDLLAGYTTLSFEGCLIQAFCIQTYAYVDIFMFTAMAYDMYLAIGHPLRYTTLMTNRKALTYIAASWCFVLVDQMVFVAWTSSLSLCGFTVKNVYCETMSLIKLSCGDAYLVNLVGSSVTLIIVMSSLLVVVYCYIRTSMICLRISREACQKAINALVTHLIAFTTYLATTLFVIFFRYKENGGATSRTAHLVLAMAGFAITSTLNPFLYGLRTEALKIKLVKRKTRIFRTG
ncbi:olfactory receptor 1J2-like [Spea bombifrons]|uniref:olfactory receptor 1J2-like n=1 Tax=Spea bombifrons TaxID=233779 RepID=UPI00234BDA01|nr:olfactory receptor 1J2-like [Spea bombifrons]